VSAHRQASGSELIEVGVRLSDISRSLPGPVSDDLLNNWNSTEKSGFEMETVSKYDIGSQRAHGS
jgi:hypothetical protein